MHQNGWRALRLVALAMAFFALSFGVAACGDDDEGGSGSSSTARQLAVSPNSVPVAGAARCACRAGSSDASAPPRSRVSAASLLIFVNLGGPTDSRTGAHRAARPMIGADRCSNPAPRCSDHGAGEGKPPVVAPDTSPRRVSTSRSCCHGSGMGAPQPPITQLSTPRATSIA